MYDVGYRPSDHLPYLPPRRRQTEVLSDALQHRHPVAYDTFGWDLSHAAYAARRCDVAFRRLYQLLQKLQVDYAYRSAAQIFDTCVQRVALSTNSTAEATALLLDVTDCSEFKTAPSDVIKEYKDEWAYLQKLEETEGCSGWCTPGEPTIWTRQHYVLDLCSKAAGNVISGKVMRSAMQLLVIGLLEFIASLFMVNTISNAMRKRDIEW